MKIWVPVSESTEVPAGGGGADGVVGVVGAVGAVGADEGVVGFAVRPAGALAVEVVFLVGRGFPFPTARRLDVCDDVSWREDVRFDAADRSSAWVVSPEDVEDAAVASGERVSDVAESSAVAGPDHDGCICPVQVTVAPVTTPATSTTAPASFSPRR